jgi:deoxyxylulose-5-phosphate synthase
LHTIRPIDREIILKAARETKLIVTCEEHSIFGGLASSIDEVVAELEPMQKRGAQYQQDPGEVRNILIKGSERARSHAVETLTEVRAAMGLSYR